MSASEGNGERPARGFVFKPDGIGDFVLATGAIRRLADEWGEENLTLCVKSLLVPLARSQFPQAAVWELPVAAERKVLNLFLRNLLFCLPLCWRLRRTRFEQAICLRSMRNYLETLIFLSARSPRHLANENLLLRGGRRVRRTVEVVVNRLRRVEVVPYPEEGLTRRREEAKESEGGWPQEVEAHRRVLERALGKKVPPDEVRPVITSSQAHAGEAAPYWICAPITNLASKRYPPAKWRDLFQALQPEAGTRRIFLVGSADQRPALEELQNLLRDVGCDGAEVFLPADLVALVDCIAGAEMLFTVDTAAAHFATALDRRTLILFSGLHRGMFAPWQRSAAQSWLEPTAPPTGKKRKWHAGIEPARAAAAARRLLRGQ